MLGREGEAYGRMSAVHGSSSADLKSIHPPTAVCEGIECKTLRDRAACCHYGDYPYWGNKQGSSSSFHNCDDYRFCHFGGKLCSSIGKDTLKALCKLGGTSHGDVLTGELNSDPLSQCSGKENEIKNTCGDGNSGHWIDDAWSCCEFNSKAQMPQASCSTLTEKSSPATIASLCRTGMSATGRMITTKYTGNIIKGTCHWHTCGFLVTADLDRIACCEEAPPTPPAPPVCTGKTTVPWCPERMCGMPTAEISQSGPSSLVEGCQSQGLISVTGSSTLEYCYARHLVSSLMLVNKGLNGCRGNTGSSKCDQCQGDCDEDRDCSTGLKCFERDGNTNIPGCAEGGSGDKWDYDYCYSPLTVVLDCQNNGVVSSTGDASYPSCKCDCPSGWGGTLCRLPVCTTGPEGKSCMNGGSPTGYSLQNDPTGTLSSVACTCDCTTTAYTGNHCDVGPCKLGLNDKACENGGTVNGVNTGICGCTCLDDYSGEHCEIVKNCALGLNDKACQNGGKATGVNGICSCACLDDYWGEYCDIAPCNLGLNGEDCQNGGTATGVNGDCSCSCLPNYTGEYCDILKNCENGLNDKKCENEGTPIGITGNCGCACKPNTFGDTFGDWCQIRSCTNGADGKPCLHDGVATGLTGNCGCDCSANDLFKGKHCEMPQCTGGANGLSCNTGSATGWEGFGLGCACDCSSVSFRGENCLQATSGKYKFLDANPKGVQSITAGVVVSDSLSFIPAVGDELRIYNQDGKTCGTTGIFTVTASNTQSGYTLDTSVVDVTDTTLCKIGGIDCGDKAYALCGWKWPNYQWSQGEKIFAKDKKNAAAGCEWTGGWTAAGDTLYCYSK